MKADRTFEEKKKFKCLEKRIKSDIAYLKKKIQNIQKMETQEQKERTLGKKTLQNKTKRKKSCKEKRISKKKK